MELTTPQLLGLALGLAIPISLWIGQMAGRNATLSEWNENLQERITQHEEDDSDWFAWMRDRMDHLEGVKPVKEEERGA